jgi:hypothetical protein
MLAADVRGAASRGELDLEATLRVAPLVAADADDRVAALALPLVQLHEEELPEPLYQRARRFRVRTFGPVARRLGWRRGKEDGDDRQALRKRVVGSVAMDGDAALAAEGTALAKAWLADPARAGLADDLVEVALGVAASQGDEALLERYLEAARKADDRAARDRLLFSLGFFRAPGAVARALAVMVGTEFDSRETMWIVIPLLRQRETRAQAWTWFQAHVDALLASRRSDEAAWLLGAVAGGFCDQAHRDEAAALLGARAEHIDGARKTVARGLEEADRCIARLARERPALERFLGAVR